MADDGSITDFRRFIDEVAAARRDTFDAAGGAPVAGAEAFEAMRRHVLGLYEGVEALHTFMDDGGQIFDCIPVEQQPSLRGSGAKVAAPPTLPPRRRDGGDGTDDDVVLESSLSPDRQDRHGNAMWCPTGTIPMRRITLEELARFESLQHYHRKAPFEPDDTPGGLQDKPKRGERCYARGGQTIANKGGGSQHTIWQPDCTDQMSLSQCWYVGYAGNARQTIEAGWMVQPRKFKTKSPVLFIYFTPDDYKTGGYNLECTGFVQTGVHFTLGGDLGKWVSRRDGTQYALKFTWLHDRSGREDNWWLYIGHDKPEYALGYYPASLFGAGQLATFSSQAVFGGEAAGQRLWPPMGSGANAAAGAKKAACISWIRVYDGNYHDWDADLVFSVLRGEAWYSVAGGNSARGMGTYLYFGGPGGRI